MKASGRTFARVRSLAVEAEDEVYLQGWLFEGTLCPYREVV